uniref:docking protein 1-like n=1 Tax=Styela clava TaxID=7725 RepID=UPI00193AD2E9|nr:docking protein 1-like [Styela clava]XP_039255329.1 docking protein 1-like [Styela clava]
MASEVRSGVLHVQKVSGLVKKFQKRYVALFKRSPHGVSRLEVYDSKDQYEKRNKGPKKHIISLESCATITRKPVYEGKKVDFYITLTFDDSKEQLFQTDSEDDMELWYASMSSVIFGGAGLTDNVIYQQYEEDGYDVVIKQNDVVNKLKLSGMYSLVVSAEDVELRDKGTKQVITRWPLQLLRKYGRDKQEFSLEAGRRCPTGPGMFYFITDHYNAIFQDVDNKVRNLAERGRAHSTSSTKAGVSPTFKPPDSPLIQTSVPPSPFRDGESEYDNPLDMRKSAASIEESIYNEPVNSKPSKKGQKGKPENPTAKGKGGKLGPQKPDRSNPKKKDKKGMKGQSLPAPPPPPQVEEAMYAEATNLSGDSDAQAYGRLDFEGTGIAKRFSNTSSDNQYDSLDSKWNEEDTTYATAGSINQRLSGLSTEEEGLYDKVQRK